MFFEVKVSDPVAKSVNNKIVQFYPIRSEIVGNNIKDDDDDDDQMGLVEYKHAGKLMAAFTSLRRFSQFSRVARVLSRAKVHDYPLPSESFNRFSATFRGEKSGV